MNKLRSSYLAVLQEIHADNALVLAASCLAFLISEVEGETARTAGVCAGRDAIPWMPAIERALLVTDR